ncbi:MAG: lysine exporter LysO family protein [Bacteroidaceae bacterium]|nr:lysine exporter LysO family protein [Bacteroidaceae bacterium]
MGVKLGTLALLTNIARELLTLLAAPLLAKFFGPLSIISAGGATTMDTVLPSVIRYSGKKYAILSIYQGFVVDFSVPFMVTLFCTL